MENPVLHHQLVTDDKSRPGQYILMLHGILGQGRNWYTIAKRWTRRHPGWGIILVDLRMHGHSQDYPPPHTLNTCAKDLEVLIRAVHLPIRVVAGHSFGGKVALAFARDWGGSLGQVWCLDTTPFATDRLSAAENVLHIARSLPMPQPSRRDVIRKLEEKGLPVPVAEWLATNVSARANNFFWDTDFDAIVQLLSDFKRTDFTEMITQPSFEFQIHIVKASDSNVISKDETGVLHQAAHNHPLVHFHILPDCGHWVHVDNPEGLMDLFDRHVGLEEQTTLGLSG